MRPIVLVVDGETGDSRNLERCLADGGYRILPAARGEEALKILARKTVDAMLLDVRLPGMGCLETLKQVREAFPPLPVIMVSERGNPGAVGDAMKHGAFDFIEMPVSPEKLRIVLSRALEQRNLRAENRELKKRIEANVHGAASAPFEIGDFRRATGAFEKQYLERKLRENGWNVSRTAERLGLDRTSVHRKMKQLGISAPGGRR